MRPRKGQDLPRWVPVVAVLLAALVLRLILMQLRWVNPDEGAHLMDGLLASRGLIPGEDFGARQPFYVYVIALFVRVFGADYQWIRLFPVIATVGAGWFVYLIGRDLVNHETGLVAAMLHLFLPFSVVLSLNTKTQMLTVLLSSAALYCIVRATKKESEAGTFRLLGGAGTLLALAYYVRQSSLAVLGSVLIVLLFVYWSDPRGFLRRAGYVFLGYSFVCILFIGGFALAGESSAGDLIRRTDLNPLWFVVSTLRASMETIGVRLSPDAVLPTISSIGPDLESFGSAVVIQTVGDQTLATAVFNIFDSIRLNGILIVGAAMSVVSVRSAMGDGSGDRQSRLQFVLPISWFALVGLAYAFWTLQRGYFQAYFLEFIPPLSILTASIATNSLRRIRGQPPGIKDLGWVVALLAAFAIIHVFTKTPMLSRSLYFTITATALGACYLFTKTDFRRWIVSLTVAVLLAGAGTLLGPPLSGIAAGIFYLVLMASVFGVLLMATPASSRQLKQRGPSFVMYSLLCASLMLTVVHSTERLDDRYLASWSPSAVEQVSNYIRQSLPSDAEILSGAVIWEFQADRRPYRNYSHPLGYRMGVSQDQRTIMREALAVSPPEMIILDGYTEQTYLRAFPEIQLLIDERYELVKVVSGSRFPVRIYEIVP